MNLPVYLLPGIAGTAAHDFAFLEPMLARRHKVIGLDLAPTADFDELVDDVLARLPVAPVALVGYSLGAAVALAAAARTASIERLVLVSGWPSAHFAAAWATGASAELARLSTFSFDDGLPEPFPLGSLTDARITMLGALDVNTEAARVTVPTLLVVAAHDAVARDTAIPAGAHRVEIDSGHAIVLERPVELLRYVDGFLDGVVREPVSP